MTDDARRFLIIAGVSLALATALGAFGTHALEPRLTAARFRSFETAVSYQFFHSLGLLGVGLLLRLAASRAVTISGWLLVAGMTLFCGSIYALTFGAPRGVIALAPVGGTLLISAWIVFVFGVVSKSAPVVRR
jgi:uncharacterized membrane protein YgdD (TMEM256/DUF423 family)